MKASHTIRPVFDDPNLVSDAGLVPVLRLAESAGLYDLLEQQLGVASPNATAKASSVVGGMLAGADSIDDLDLLRHGGMPRLFVGVRAPSTLGTFLRSFTHGHVQQLDAVGGDLLAGLTDRVPGVIAGSNTTEGVAFLDVDDTIHEVHGHAKQAAAYGYTRVRGLNIQLATLSTPLAAPVIARARLRKGSTASAKGAGRLLAQAIGTARAAGVTGRILCRADSAYYGWAFVGTAIRKKTWFSVTARMTKTVTTAIAGIAEDAWTPIKYPNAVFDEAEQRWISDAEVAEVPFTAFTGRRKTQEEAEASLMEKPVYTRDGNIFRNAARLLAIGLTEAAMFSIFPTSNVAGAIIRGVIALVFGVLISPIVWHVVIEKTGLHKHFVE